MVSLDTLLVESPENEPPESARYTVAHVAPAALSTTFSRASHMAAAERMSASDVPSGINTVLRKNCMRELATAATQPLAALLRPASTMKQLQMVIIAVALSG